MNIAGLFDLVPGPEASGASSWEGVHSDRQEKISKCQDFALRKIRFPVQLLAILHLQ